MPIAYSRFIRFSGVRRMLSSMPEVGSATAVNL